MGPRNAGESACPARGKGKISSSSGHGGAASGVIMPSWRLRTHLVNLILFAMIRPSHERAEANSHEQTQNAFTGLAGRGCFATRSRHSTPSACPPRAVLPDVVWIPQRRGRTTVGRTIFLCPGSRPFSARTGRTCSGRRIDHWMRSPRACHALAYCAQGRLLRHVGRPGISNI